MAPSLLRCELKGGSGELKDIGVPARGDSQFIERERYVVVCRYDVVLYLYGIVKRIRGTQGLALVAIHSL